MAKTLAIVLACCLAFAAVATAHKEKHSKHDKYGKYSDKYSDSYSGGDGSSQYPEGGYSGSYSGDDGSSQYPEGGKYSDSYSSGGYSSSYSGGDGSTQYPEGWNKYPGRITAIYCYLNEHGNVAGLAYRNEYTGYKTFCDRPGSGYYSNDCVAPGCQKLELGALENVIRVEACRGGKYGYTSVTFTTDADAKLSCGTGDYSYQPPNYSEYGSDYQKGYYYKGYGQRKLLETADSSEDSYAGADLDHYSKKGYGWGWNSKCQVYEPPSQPSWAGDNKEWYSGGYNSGKYGYAQDSAYSKSWKAYDSYYQYAGKDGKQSYYYKDYNTYKKYADGCASSSCDYTPDYYYKQVWPLASFKAKCDRDGSVYDVYKLKWNEKYMAPKPENVMPIVLTITLDGGVTCAEAPVAALQANISALLTTMGTMMAPEVSHIDLDPNSVQCVDSTAAANTTVTMDVAVYAAEGYDVTDVVKKFDSYHIVSGTDLCPLIGEMVPGAACEWPVEAAVCTWKFQSWSRLQSMLVDNKFRQQLKNYITIVKN